MANQNVTLSLPADLVRKAKVWAAEEGTSISRLLRDALTQRVEDREAYSRARRRHLAILRNPPDLGTGGQPGWTRDDLHER